MSVENHARLMDPKLVNFAYRQPHKLISDLVQPTITQRQSQMKYSILKILTTLDDYDSMNTSQIHKWVKINWTSLKRSTNLLCEKKVLTMKQHQFKKNNEKIYYLNRIRAIIFLDRLFNHRKTAASFKKYQKYTKSFERFTNTFPKDIWNLWVFFSPKMQNKLKIQREHCLLRGLREDQIKKVLMYYKNGDYCLNCQDKNSKKVGIRNWESIYLSNLIVTKEGTAVCEVCNSEQSYQDIPLKPKNLKKIIAKKNHIKLSQELKHKRKSND